MTILNLDGHKARPGVTSPDETTYSCDTHLPVDRPCRSLTVLFRRDPSRDRVEGKIAITGYRLMWPNEEPVGASLSGFCTRGQRLLGLDRRLAGQQELPIDVLWFPLQGREDPLIRLPGHRVRRFFGVRTGNALRLHFLDGTPTETMFVIGRDEERILHWIGIREIEDGSSQWVDIVARVTPSLALSTAA